MTSATRVGPLEPLALPSGMRDLLPLEAHTRRSLAKRFLEHVDLHGYSLVLLPAFELASVLERGLGTLDPRELLRFIEPESGEVAALRPDMTPQVARLVASRLHTLPPPIRLAYEGTVLRRRQERARRHRQISQAGVELLGLPSPEGDIEILQLVVSCLRELGLDDFVIEVGHARLASELVRQVSPPWREEVTEALMVRDTGRVRVVLDRAVAQGGVSPRVAAALGNLSSWRGSLEILNEACSELAGTAAEEPLIELQQLAARCETSGVGSYLCFDLAVIGSLAYYTGFQFQILAGGPGAALGGGGRYDDLLGRFGMQLPAVGFALDLDHVAWARHAVGIEDPRPLRVVVTTTVNAPGSTQFDRQRSLRVVDALRERGIPALVSESSDPQAWSRAWSMTALLTPVSGGWKLLRLDTGASVWHAPEETPRHADEPAHIATWVMQCLSLS